MIIFIAFWDSLACTGTEQTTCLYPHSLSSLKKITKEKNLGFGEYIIIKTYLSSSSNNKEYDKDLKRIVRIS